MILLGGSLWGAEDGPLACGAGRNGSARRWRSPSGGRISWTTTIPNYAGDLGVGMNPRWARAVQADAIVLLGAELNDITTRTSP
jgi:thiamine pyrophosphate-dependent acetolactate synthase large subunit-like protein